MTSALNDSDSLMPLMTLKDRIKEAVNSALTEGKSKAEIARGIPVTQSSLTQWLKGDIKSLKAESADGLQRVTGYQAHWLISGKGPKKTGAAALPRDWSPQAVALAEQLDWIKDPRRRTAD